MSDELDRSVAGDKDRWMLFNRQTAEGYPLVVLSRTGNYLVETGLDHGMVTIVHCDASEWNVNDRGMPQNSELLYPIEERLAEELDALHVDALHIASVTGDGQRRIVFVHEGALQLEAVLSNVAIEGYSFRVSQPLDRVGLKSLLLPTSLDHQLDGDLGVISNIEKHGDNGHEPRKTDFWFYGELVGLEGVVSDLVPWGFSVDHWLSEPEGVVVTCNTPVHFGTFEELTPVLVMTAEKHRVTYDGWEAFVLGSNEKAQSSTEVAKPVSLLSKLFGAKKN